MSKKRTKYSAEFKSQLVLELLKNERTISEIASDNNITPQNLQGWKKIFLDNAVIAMEPSKAIKEYKDDLAKSQEENEMLVKLVGKVTIEKEWLEKKLRSLASSDKKDMIEPKRNDLSLRPQCQLLGLNRSSLYYQKKENVKQNWITRFMDCSKKFKWHKAGIMPSRHPQFIMDGTREKSEKKK